MKFFELLPCKPEEVNDYVKDELIKVHADLALIIDEDQAAEVRARSERLSSYLGRLNTILSSFRQLADFNRNVWVAKNPKPEKGITEWRESRDNETLEQQRICEHVEGVIKSIETRISTTQSNMKNRGKE